MIKATLFQDFLGGEPVKETLSLIDQTLKEHEEIMLGVETSEGIANDLTAMSELDSPIESFVLGRPGDQRQSLNDLQESLKKVDEVLQEHFDREEKALLTAFEKRPDKMLASAFSALLHEHKELRDRIARSRENASELATGSLSRDVWEGKAHGLRAYMRHTRKLIEAHADSEWELLQRLRAQLEGA